nr:MAG TPA: hypothetical protein [Caudoviricetes sp.]
MGRRELRRRIRPQELAPHRNTDRPAGRRKTSEYPPPPGITTTERNLHREH